MSPFHNVKAIVSKSSKKNSESPHARLPLLASFSILNRSDDVKLGAGMPGVVPEVRSK